MTLPDPPPATPSRARRVPLTTWLALLVGGAVLGTLGAVVQADRRVVGDRTVAWGLVLVVVVVAVCVRAGSWFVGDRRGGACVALGWLVPTVVLAGSGPGGDVILAAGARTTWYLGATAGLALVALLWPLPRGTAALVAEHRERTWERRVAAADAGSDGPDEANGSSGAGAPGPLPAGADEPVPDVDGRPAP